MRQTGHTPTHPAVDRCLDAAFDHRRAGRDGAAAVLYRQVLDVDADHPVALDGLRELGAARAPQREPLVRRAPRRIAREALHAVTTRARVWKYRTLSTGNVQGGKPRILQPVQFVGPGTVVLGEGVQFGWPRSPAFYSGYCYVEAASPGAVIELGDRAEFNNNLFVKSEGAGIRVGADALFGANIEIFDSNFHDLHPERRHGGQARMAPVDVGPNVFVGMGVRILKGVTIGADSVIGAGSVVSGDIPAGVIAAGNPARVVREL